MRFTKFGTKFLVIGVFLFILAYANRDSIPVPTELTTLDLVTAGGIDILANNNNENDNEKEFFSLSYLSSESGGGTVGNEDKDVFNVKSHTLNSAIEQMQSVTNRTMKDSHLDYVLIGEETARGNLSYFIQHYARSPSVRFDAHVFIAKSMSAEEFFEKALTSDISVNARVDTILRDRTQISSFVTRNLKDLLQIYYSKEKTGLIPVLEIVESPIDSKSSKSKEDPRDNDDDGEEDEEENENEADGEERKEEKNENNNDDRAYTFSFGGLGIIKDGKLVGFIEEELARAYIILTKNLTTGTIEVTDENGILSTFGIKSTSHKISFETNERGIPVKVRLDVGVDVNFNETMAQEQILTDENIPILNELKNEAIKSEIELLIAKSKATGADFLRIGDAFAMRHPYKFYHIRDDWNEIFLDLEYDIQVGATLRRYFNINAYH